jgi:hypothetical protein
MLCYLYLLLIILLLRHLNLAITIPNLFFFNNSIASVFVFLDKLFQSILVLFSFNNSIAFGFYDNIPQSNFSGGIQSFSLYLTLKKVSHIYLLFFQGYHLAMQLDFLFALMH